MDFWSTVYVFVLASFIGLGVIRRVSRLLHTPLMSLTNAISAIAVVGSILVTGGDYPLRIRILGAIALFASMTNIVSGFLITDRMLKMFKTDKGEGGHGDRGDRALGRADGHPSRLDRPGDRRGISRRHSALEGAADRGAAADRAVPCLWRSRCRSGRHGRVLPATVGGRRPADDVPDGGPHRGSAARIPHVHRQPDGGREAAGSERS